jgi:hypothetical protein
LAIPTVRDWTATEVVTEAKLDEISTALNFLLAPPRVYAYKSADGALANAAWGALNFNAESYDSHAAHDNTTNNTRLVAPEAGLYTVKAHTRFAAHATGARGINIRKNANAVQTAGTDVFFTFSLPSSGNVGYVFGSVDVQLGAGDYLESFAYQSSGGALNVLGGITETFMSFIWKARTV